MPRLQRISSRRAEVDENAVYVFHGEPSAPEFEGPEAVLRRTVRREAPQALLSPGDVVAQRYRVVRFIAEGSSCRVYECRDLRSDSPYALRIARDTEPALVERFQVESIAYGLFESPHLPRLYDAGRIDGAAPFMVLDLFPPQTLRTRLEHGPLGVPAAVDAGRQLLTALEHCHERGFVHCDVKPANIIVDGSGPVVTLKLIDFGICRRVHKFRTTELPPAETVVGTPSYMSPEQAQGMDLDPRTDLYSVAVILYRTLTGRLPFQGSSAQEVLRAIMTDPVLPPSAIRPSCPAELERTIMRGMSRERHYRFDSARAMLDELTWVQRRCGLSTDKVTWSAHTSIVPCAIDGSAETRRISSIRPAVQPPRSARKSSAD